MLFPRSSGVLLHPTSLPGRYGIGDLGEYAYRFVDYLQSAGQTIWQVLPLGPTSYGDSPYQCLSAFAGNPNLISLDKLVGDGWLTDEDLMGVPDFPRNRVDYGPVIDYHNQKLALAYTRFAGDTTNESQRAAFEAWCAKNAHWLDDFALFVALKNENGLLPWTEWPEDVSLRDPGALAAAQIRLKIQIEDVRFRQWVFFTQWHALKDYANGREIRMVGDLPIFVAHDSSDVWANRGDYFLDERGNPTYVAGVPPDYFSATGQRWGNPLYRWDVMKARGYSWWISRFSAILSLVDLVRIDHFRAFEDYWEIPAGEPTAVNGVWRKGPNIDFFNVLRERLGALPIIAEDLGMITPAVEKLRDDLNLPGMKIIQFGWSDPDNEFLPHNYVTTNCVVYTGTHDNNTVVGWFNGEGSEGERNYFQAYVDRHVIEPHWDMIRLGMASVGHTFVAPLQDIFGLGRETRMNTPGVESGNWGWRFTDEWFYRTEPRDRLAHLTHLYSRWPGERRKIRG